jgi:hypothetical protein
MSRILQIKESDLVNMIKNIIIEETDSEEIFYDLTPEQYYKLLQSVGNQAQAIPKLPMFKGKKVRVNGGLDLNGKPIKSLGEIVVTGRLNFPYTEIKSLEGVSYGSLGSYYGTPFDEEIKRKKRQKEKNDADQRRIDDEWNLMDTDKTGEMAHAVFSFMVNEGDIDELSYPEVEELIGLKRKLKELEDRLETEEDDEVYDEIYTEIEEVQEEIDDLEKKDNDVYGLIEDGGSFFMTNFRSIHDDTYGNIYAVGTTYDADKSMREYYEDLTDDLSNFNRDTLSYHIDGDEVAEYFEDMVREWIYDDPSNYDVKRDLSDYQERQIKDSQLEIDSLKLEAFLLDYGFLPPLEFVVNRENNWEYTDGENNKINLVVGQDGKYDVFKNGTPTLKNPIYDEGIDWDEISDLVEERKSEIESEIDSIEYDIEQIKEEPEGDPDEDDVENEVESLLDQIKDDPVRWLDDYSIDYKQFIDINSLIRDLIDEGDYDVLATYDGTYDEIDINGESYIVYRVD